MGGVGGTTVTSGGNPSSDAALELYKLEYERAAIRYEDIYRAMWQIFAYLTALSTALLAFGSESFQANLFACLVCLPLLFWFWATFLPLNRYGDECGKRLAAIENHVNNAYGTKLGHYQGFEGRRGTQLWKKVRVRSAVVVFFFLLHLFFLWQATATFYEWRAHMPMLRKGSAEVKIITVSPEDLRKILEKAVPAEDTAPTGAEAKTKEN